MRCSLVDVTTCYIMQMVNISVTISTVLILKTNYFHFVVRVVSCKYTSLLKHYICLPLLDIIEEIALSI